MCPPKLAQARQHGGEPGIRKEVQKNALGSPD